MKIIKYRGIIFICLMAILVFLLFQPVRTRSVMKEIAKEQMGKVVFDEFGKADYKKVLTQLQGPVISRDTERFVIFQWFKELKDGDSASIYVSVYRNPFFPGFYFPPVTKSKGWGYFRK